MRVLLKDLGIIKQAEFEVGDLTILCGANNTGKTYATYALFGFFDFWNEGYSHEYIGSADYKKLVTQGSISVIINDIYKAADEIISTACEEYSSNLPMVFGAKKNSFISSSFKIELGNLDYAQVDREIKVKGPSGKPLCEIRKVRGKSIASLKIVANAEDVNKLDDEWFLYQINRDIQKVLFGDYLPVPFIVSIERTGAATFQKELDFSRNRLIEHVSNREKDINPITLIRTYFDGGYALPVKRDVDFIRDLEKVQKNESIIAQNYPDIVKDFDSLSGGTYRATKEGLCFIPDKSRGVKLTMGESASSVRSLLNLGMYIKHLATPGDFLMIDEPELNLHPMNQRLIARLIAKLVNAGIRVYITTHSDYILKEFNALIMIKNAGDQASYIKEKYSYEESELLDADRIKAFIAKKDLIKIDGAMKKQRLFTFKKATVDSQGIEIAEFDDTINIMNEVQEYLLYNGGIL